MRQIRTLRSWHYVKYRSARTNRLRKFSSRVKLVAEVYSTRKKGRVGFINRIERGKPVSQKFSSKAKLLYHEGRKPKREIVERTYEDTFYVNYNNWIPDQIPHWFTNILNEQIDNKGHVQFRLRLTGRDNKKLDHDIRTAARNYISRQSHRNWTEILTQLIVTSLRSDQIRTSPKKFSKVRYWYRGKRIAEWHYIKRYRVQLILQSTH